MAPLPAAPDLPTPHGRLSESSLSFSELDTYGDRLLLLLLSLWLLLVVVVEVEMILLPSPFLEVVGTRGGLPLLPAGLLQAEPFPTDVSGRVRVASSVAGDAGWEGGGGGRGGDAGLFIATFVASSASRAATLSLRLTASSSSHLSFLRRSMTSHTPGVTPAEAGGEET